MTAEIAHRIVAVDDPEIGTADLSLHETGARNDRALVFLHGSGPGANALSNWEHVIGEMGDSFHCLAPDIVGFGDSTHPDPAPVGMPAFTEARVRTLIALFDELGLERVTLVGNSMGGLISIRIALREPERVERMVLMGSAGGQAELLPGLFTMIGFYDDPSADNMEALLRLFLHDPDAFGDDLRGIAEARLPNTLRPEVERSHRATFDFSQGPVAITPEQLATIEVPVLLMHGDHDKIVSIDSSRDLATKLPNARLQVVENTGHWLQIESPEVFVDSVREFAVAVPE